MAGGSRAFERRIVSVLFADLVGFTPLSERLDAEDVAAIQDAYFAAVRETVARYGGRLEKFIGDAAVGAFGIPRARDDDAERAVRAGLAIVRAVEVLAAQLGLGTEELRVRVGIATGEVAHATDGPDEGRITGDTVNTAARLQAAAPPGRVLVGEETALAVADAAELEPAQAIELKGKAEPVRTRLVVGMRPARSREAAMGRLRAPTTGRDAELGALRDALDRVAAGGREAWLIVAPPGIGKSRLLAELVAMAALREIPVGSIRCRVEPESPFAPLAALVRSLLGPSDGDVGVRERLEAGGLGGGRVAVVATEIEALLGRAASPGGGRDARFEAWAEGLEALGPNGPHAWLVEDLHWGSADLVAFLERLATRDGAPRLVVMTARPSLLERDPELAAGSPDAAIRRLELQPLPPAAAGELVDRLVGGALPAGLVARIAERADGNPLFIEELLRVWVSVGTLVPDGEGWRLALTPDEISLPTTVQAIYAAQLDDLPEAARRAARRGSVSGRRIPIDVLPVLEVPDREDAVEQLVRRAIVRSVEADPIAGPTVAYRHALLRDAGYASLARAERARLHVRLARWLEATAGERAEAVAASIGAHWEAAVANASALAPAIDEGLDRATARATAAAWLETGAAVASRTAAYEAAVELLDRSLALTDDDHPVDRARRLTARADAERLGGSLRAATEGYAAAVELSGPLLERASGDGAGPRDARVVFSDAAAKLAEVRIEQLDFAAAAVGAAAALERLGPAEDAARLRVEIDHSRATVALDNDYAAALARAERLLDAARRTGDRALIRIVRTEHVGALHEADRATPADWQAIADEAVTIGDWTEAVDAGTNAAMLLLSIDPTAVEPALEPLAAMVDAHRLREAGCWIDYLRAEAGLVLGRWERVVEAGERVLAAGIAHGFDRVTVRTLHCLVPVAARRGEAELLARCSAWFDQRGGRFPNSPYGQLFRAAVDTHLARAGLIEDRRRTVDELRAGLSLGEGGPSWLTALETVVGRWIDEGLLDEAAEAASLLDGSATSGGAAGAVVVGLLRTRLAAARGDDVAERAEQLAADAAAIPAPWWAAQALRLVRTADATARAARLEAALGVAARTGPGA